MARAPRPPKDRKQLDPLLVTLPASTLLFRVHPADVDPTAFNPGIGTGGRFHFITALPRGVVPAFYCAEDPYAALAETVFHDVPNRGTRGVSFKRKIVGRVLSPLRTRRELTLVQLHDLGLKRLKLAPREITDTNPSAYPRTVEWAQALHDGTRCEGLVWMSRHFNSKKALTLFGDRASAPDLELAGSPISLWESPGVSLVYEIAEAADIAVFRA